MKRLLIALALSPTLIYACDCRTMTPAEAKAHAEIIFRGKIVALRDANRKADISNGRYVLARDTGKAAVFQVSRVWKGNVGATFEMPAVGETTACTGFWPDLLKVGADLLVYASRFSSESSDYYTGICNRTRLVNGAPVTSFDGLGPGQEPHASPKATP